MKKAPPSWVWVPPVEQEVDEEIAFHLEMHTRDLIANGMAPDAAREAARQRLGDLHRLRRECVSLGRKRDRIMRTTQWLDDVWDDFLVALRRLQQSPGFTSAAVLTLALGIGANSALFALADAALLRPLPFPAGDRLVRLADSKMVAVGPYEAVEWVTKNHTFDAMAAVTFGTGRRAMTGPDGVGEQVDTQTVTLRFFDVFRVVPVAGRTFQPSDDHPNPDAVVLSERLWNERFGRDPGLVGRRIRVDGSALTVIGIVPAEFQIFTPSGMWMLMASAPMHGPTGMGHYLRVVGRLAPGATLSSAAADLTSIADAIAKQRPDLNKDHGVRLEPLRDSLIGSDLQLTAKLLLGVVACVLLTCCANVANLVLARTSSRARELAIRSALGAGGRRIVRLLFTESVVLAGLAAVLGAAVGAAILDVAPSLMPAGVLPVDVRPAFDRRVLAFCAAAAFALALAFSALPAWQATRMPWLPAISAGGRTSTGGGSRFRAVLAAGQIAAAVVLLCGAGLLVRSFIALTRVDSGSRASELLTMTLRLPSPGPATPDGIPYKSFESRLRFYEAVEREVRSVPGVRNVAFGSALPLDGWWMGMFFGREGDQRPEQQRELSHFANVGPGYFATLGIPLIAGREFTRDDRADSPPVCIVNEVFARRYLEGRAPIGTRLVVRGATTSGGPLPVRDIVGVVRNVKERPEETDPEPEIYVPIAQDPATMLSFVVQPAGESAAALGPAVRAAIARVDRERPVLDMRTVARIRRDATSPARFRAVLLGAFGTLALTLAVIGVFGVLTYSVQQRVREFGVRIALGARASQVLTMVFGDTARIVGVGVGVGLVAAAALGRSMATFLFGVPPTDPLTFAGVALLLALTASLATAIPALRAARVDPVVALRDQ